MAQDFLPGDVVSVDVPNEGKREGLVIGTTIDNVGRQIVEIQFDRPRPYRVWYPYPDTYVRRVRRSVAYSAPYPHYHKAGLVERQVHYDF